MEKIIFFALAVPILGFVFYLGGSAIMKGFKAKVDNRPVKSEEKEEHETQVSPTNSNDLSNEISKLNELHKSGVLTQEEFEKAKSKLLNN
ncbi:SHOCT domain-containing protein [Candidatus Pelagibacter sp.]|uniref:SHOCT domain-containing protein n=1 Tax=Candidatus Pelagibacter sp. TaxID=2024849 RepID=UPI003D0E893A